MFDVETLDLVVSEGLHCESATMTSEAVLSFRGVNTQNDPHTQWEAITIKKNMERTLINAVKYIFLE